MRYVMGCVVLAALVATGCTPATEPGTGPVGPAAAGSAEKAVRAAIAEILTVKPSDIPMDTPISDPPLKADELDLVEIVMELEDRQGISISDESLERLSGGKLDKGMIRITPNQLVQIVNEAPKAKQPKRKPK